MTDLPDIAPRDSEFEFLVGETTLVAFALDHTPADVLRELVQNEYDAGGTSMELSFGVDRLTVRGNGRAIDAKGWKRLGVMLGTGDIPGTGGHVDAKPNGIGSKNFGMRSLFRFGDRISVASDGRRTELDRTKGSLKVLREDPAPRGVPGVTIEVPYREVSGLLPAFDEAQEAEAMTSIADELAGTLIKLAKPGSDNSLRDVTVRSTRLGHELNWHQTVRTDRKLPGMLRRRVAVRQSGVPLAGIPPFVAETEFQRSILVPPNLREHSMPGYFRVAGGRARLGISFGTGRGGLDLSEPGIFFYPLGAKRAFTGFPFGANAPFDMSGDRSAVLPLSSSPWNAWLVEELASFAVDLLEERLFPLYGVDAFHALDPGNAGAAALGELPERIATLLGERPCWPNAVEVRGRSVFVEGARPSLRRGSRTPRISSHGHREAGRPPCGAGA